MSVHYTVVATRSEGWWALAGSSPDGPEIFTQSRRLEQAEAMVRDAVALTLGLDPDDVAVTLDVELDEETRRRLEAARQAQEQARASAASASEQLRATAAYLTGPRGLSVRDAGQLMDVSPQRVSQLRHG